MKAEIIITGDEILNGYVADINSSFIADEFLKLGISVNRIHIVGDERDQLVDVLRDISGRSSLVIVSGGLGPTHDDVTAEAASMAAGKELVLFDDVFSAIQNHFIKLNKTMPISNKKQALLPQGSEWLFNEIGSAPGFSLTIGKALCYFLPGVPRELKKMFCDRVLPEIKAQFQAQLQPIYSRTISLFGISEAAVGEKLRVVMEQFPSVSFNICASLSRIAITIQDSGEGLLESVLSEMRAILDHYIFSENGQTLEEAVGALLLKKNQTVATAESCTGGLIASKITDVAGSSSHFMGGVITYSNMMKQELLGVSEQTLSRYGAVSQETVKEMAEGVRELANATYGLSISGIAGPSGGSDEKPVGTVMVGLAVEGAPTETFAFQILVSDRRAAKERFAAHALNVLRYRLVEGE